MTATRQFVTCVFRNGGAPNVEIFDGPRMLSPEQSRAILEKIVRPWYADHEIVEETYTDKGQGVSVAFLKLVNSKQEKTEYIVSFQDSDGGGGYYLQPLLGKAWRFSKEAKMARRLTNSEYMTTILEGLDHDQAKLEALGLSGWTWGSGYQTWAQVRAQVQDTLAK